MKKIGILLPTWQNKTSVSAQMQMLCTENMPHSLCTKLLQNAAHTFNDFAPQVHIYRRYESTEILRSSASAPQIRCSKILLHNFDITSETIIIQLQSTNNPEGTGRRVPCQSYPPWCRTSPRSRAHRAGFRETCGKLSTIRTSTLPATTKQQAATPDPVPCPYAIAALAQQ